MAGRPRTRAKREAEQRRDSSPARVPSTGDEGQSERVLEQGAGADILATTAHGPSSIISPAQLNAEADLVLDMPLHSGPLERGPIVWEEHRVPALKDVGRDANGKTIPHIRTDAVAKIVASWVARGASENFICTALNMRPGLLRELYANELAHGAEIANLEVAGAAYDMAVSRTSEQMTKFWLERRHKAFKSKEDNKEGNLFNIIIHS